MKVFLITVGLGTFLLLGSVSAYAATVEETAADQRVRNISKQLRCAVCQNESVYDSNADLAVQMRALIREKVEAGASDEEIVAYFVSRYGDYILMEPRKEGVNWLLWLAPLWLLAAGILLVLGLVKRWRREGAAGPAVPDPDGHLHRRLEEEIRRSQGKGDA
jgi:cytochrome c-type biogenesis protein CcmH